MLVLPIVLYSLSTTDTDVLLLNGICVQYNVLCAREASVMAASNSSRQDFLLFVTIRILQLFYLFVQSFFYCVCNKISVLFNL